MTKIEFATKMVEKNDMTKKAAAAAYDAVFGGITAALLDWRDVRTPIGIFKVKEVADREFVIQLVEHKGEKSISPADKVVKFKANASLKKDVK